MLLLLFWKNKFVWPFLMVPGNLEYRGICVLPRFLGTQGFHFSSSHTHPTMIDFTIGSLKISKTVLNVVLYVCVCVAVLSACLSVYHVLPGAHGNQKLSSDSLRYERL